jgi:hypothetical protein
MMNAPYALMLLVIASGALSAGCYDPSGALDPSLLGPPPARVLNGPGGGSGTGNHFLPEHFHVAKYNVIQGFDKPMGGDDAHDVNGSLSNLLSTLAGRESFENAASCSLSAGDYVTYADPITQISTYVFGVGFIRNADMWHYEQVTDEDTKHGVLTCMAARLNPFGQVVPILGLGPMVPYDGVTDTADYPYIEMVISAEIDPTSDRTVIINVWPQQDLEDSCKDKVEESLGTRLCDDNPQGCGLVRRHDFETACTGEPGYWTCDGRPAIETRLRTVDVPTLYPECEDK